MKQELIKEFRRVFNILVRDIENEPNTLASQMAIALGEDLEGTPYQVILLVTKEEDDFVEGNRKAVEL